MSGNGAVPLLADHFGVTWVTDQIDHGKLMGPPTDDKTTRNKTNLESPCG